MTEREPLAFTPEEEAEERAFIRKYGALAPFDPPQLAEFMAGFPRPWWIVGGWSIEAFTGAPREHEDVDLSILACDVPALREHVDEDEWHLWSNYGGALRPLDDSSPSRSTPDSQIWVRRSAQDRRGSSTCRSRRTATACGPTSGCPTTSRRSRT